MILQLLIFSPVIILVLLGMLGKNIHINAINIVGIYTLAWGVFFLIMQLVYPALVGSLLWGCSMILSCAVVGSTLIASKRDIRLAKLSALLAVAAMLFFKFGIQLF